MPRAVIALMLSASTLLAGPTRQERIKAVEEGLLPAVLIKGVPTWKLLERMRELRIPGASVAVIQDYEVDWTKGYGIKDIETGERVSEATVFQAGSISKPVAAAVALRKVEEGALSLDIDINRVLTSWKVPENEFTQEEKVTLKRLLSHSAGLTVHGFPGYDVASEVPTVPQLLDGQSPANTPPVRVDIVPGTRLRYSGGGTTVMQQALIDLSGMAFPELARTLVLDPAGMVSSTYEQPLPPSAAARAASGHRSGGNLVEGRWHIYPEMAAAGLWTTSEDLARFAIEIQKAVRGDSAHILSPSMARQMLRPVIDNAALGFFLERRGGEIYFEHGGADEGFRAALVASRDRGYGAVVMVNSDNGQILNEIIRGIATVYGWEGYGQEVLEPLTLTPEELDRFAGVFLVHEDRLIRIDRQGEALEVAEYPEKYRLYPITALEFARPDRRARYVFGGHTGEHPDTLLIKDREPTMAVRLPASFTPATPRELVEAGDHDAARAAYRGIRSANPSSKAVEESRLNALGYEYLRDRRIPEAIAILQLNLEFYPDSWNVYDSLGEAYMVAGENETAISYYRRSLEMNPENENGRIFLKKLEGSRQQ